MERVDVHLLGGFCVEVDSRELTAEQWEHGRAMQLVKLLALSPGHRLARDRVLEALWPDLEPDAGAANLHKAASHARRTLGDRRAVVLRRGQVELAPDAAVTTDLERFEDGDGDAYAGELLPDDRYEEWTLEPRERARAARLARLQEQERWDELLAEDPTNEVAHRAQIRALAEAGDRAGAVRRFRRVRDELAGLGLTPEPETIELVAELSRGPAVQVPSSARGELIGRERELRLIEKAIERSDGGAGGVLVLVGDPGIGKTRLAEAALFSAGERGWHALRGAASQREGEVPYEPVLSALEPLLRERPDLLSGLSEGSAEALAELVPSLPRPAEPPASLSRADVLGSTGELVEAAARERGLLLCLEDAHAVDEATIHLVSYLASSAGALRLLLVLCLRGEEERAEVAKLRATLARQRTAATVTVGPLDPNAVRAIAEQAHGGALTDEAAAAIERLSGGNPFFAEELSATRGPAGEVTVPDHVHEALELRLDRLDAHAQDLLPFLTALEEPFSPGEVATVAGAEEDGVLEALEGAAQVGVLSGSADDGYTFRHPLLGDAARRSVPAARLAAAHSAAAAMLVEAGGWAERIARHLLEAGEADAAVPHLTEAAERAVDVAAYDKGLAWVEEALRHANPEQHPELLALLAVLRDRTGDPDAPGAYERAIAVASPAAQPGLRIQQARAYLATGSVEAAERVLERLDLAGADVADRARATIARGLIGWHAGDIDTARSCVQEAAVLVEEAGLTDLVVQQEDLAAMVAHADGDWGRHVSWRLGETWELPEVAGRVYDAYLCVTEYVMQAGEPYDGLREFARQLREKARQAGARRGEAFATTILGEAELLSGQPREATAHLAEAARLGRQVRAPGSEAAARIKLAEGLLELGNRDDARAQIEEALALAHHGPMAQHLLPAAHAVSLRIASEAGEAMESLERAGSILDERATCDFCAVGYHVAAASACANAGELERGWELVARAEEGAGQWAGWTPWSAAVNHARGELLAAAGEREEAAAAFRRAIEGFAGSGQRLNEARARGSLSRLG